jgi:hypothetical protein
LRSKQLLVLGLAEPTSLIIRDRHAWATKRNDTIYETITGGDDEQMQGSRPATMHPLALVSTPQSLLRLSHFLATMMRAGMMRAASATVIPHRSKMSSLESCPMEPFLQRRTRRETNIAKVYTSILPGLSHVCHKLPPTFCDGRMPLSIMITMLPNIRRRQCTP